MYLGYARPEKGEPGHVPTAHPLPRKVWRTLIPYDKNGNGIENIPSPTLSERLKNPAQRGVRSGAGLTGERALDGHEGFPKAIHA
jgi:hypothetical protein